MKANVLFLYEKFEEERQLTLTEAEAVERSATSCDDRDLAIICKMTKDMVEDLKISISNVKTNDPKGSDEMEGCQERHRNISKKCRHYNRGFCKFGRSCKYYHPKLVCEVYLQDGLCLQRKCPKRHPRHCRYWSSKSEGCTRNEECQYLHLE